MAAFRAFIPNADQGPVFARGADFICRGCQGVVPHGMYLFERVEKDGRVTGTRWRAGWDGPIGHACGDPPPVVAPERRHVTDPKG